MNSPAIVTLDSVRFSIADWAWPFARDRRAEIDAHFDRRKQRSPALWNGRILLLRDYALTGRHLDGTFFEARFADLMAWRDWGFPDADAVNAFAMGALRTSDGAYVLGVMGAHTSNPGSVYFPSGTPDPADVTGGSVDLFASVQREVTEETGLAAADFVSEPGWVAVLAGPQLALMKPLQLVLGAEEVARRVRGFLGRERNPELADVRIVRRRAELPGECPQFMTSFLRWALAE